MLQVSLYLFNFPRKWEVIGSAPPPPFLPCEERLTGEQPAASASPPPPPIGLLSSTVEQADSSSTPSRSSLPRLSPTSAAAAGIVPERWRGRRRSCAVPRSPSSRKLEPGGCKHAFRSVLAQRPPAYWLPCYFSSERACGSACCPATRYASTRRRRSGPTGSTGPTWNLCPTDCSTRGW
jgi:hypothetical protein